MWPSYTCAGMERALFSESRLWRLTQELVLALQQLLCALCQLAVSMLARLGSAWRIGELC